MSNKELIDILTYCRPNIKIMWAAYICGIILSIDFRDVTEEKIDNAIASLARAMR